MADEFGDFAQISPYLTQPLVLAGFVSMLVFGVHQQLLKAGIIPALNRQQGSRVVRLLLHYGFALGGLIAIGGFGLSFMKCRRIRKSKPGPSETNPITPSTNHAGL